MLIRLNNGEHLTVTSGESKKVYTFICKKGFLGVKEFLNKEEKK